MMMPLQFQRFVNDRNYVISLHVSYKQRTILQPHCLVEFPDSKKIATRLALVNVFGNCVRNIESLGRYGILRAGRSI